jgi:predicted peptidase
MYTKEIFLSLATCVLAATALHAETTKPVPGTLESQSLKKVIRKTVTCDYLLYLPEDYGKEPRKRWPLVLFLHGAGERGSDVEKVKFHGPPKLIGQGKKFEAIVVSPQCPEDSWWSGETDTLFGLLDEIESKYKVDKKREYVTGLSMGGYGTWSLAIQQPRRFAAIAPICGGTDPKYAPIVKDIPIWVFHGEKDSVVPFAQSKDMVDAIKAAGGNPKFTAYPGVDHDSWTATYDNPDFWTWLFEQRK